jgi:hypothetical protein
LANKVEKVNVPFEEVIELNDEAIEQRIGIQ